MWHLSPKDQYFPRHFPAYQCALNVNMNRNQAFCVALAIFLLQSISIRQQQMVAFFILYMRWINSYQAILNIAMIRRRNRRLRRQRQRIAPYAWSIPRPAEWETRIVKTRIVKPTHVFWYTISRPALPRDCKSRDFFIAVIEK